LPNPQIIETEAVGGPFLFTSRVALSFRWLVDNRENKKHLAPRSPGYIKLLRKYLPINMFLDFLHSIFKSVHIQLYDCIFRQKKLYNCIKVVK
jgi:hypothetical protein